MTIGELWRRVVRLVRSGRAEDELREEMALHVELRARAISGRADDVDAHAAAHRQFGNEVTLRAKSRDQWGFHWAEHAARDMRYAARRIVQRPAFSIAVVGLLALGIGTTTAIFSAVDAAMLRPLPFADPAALVVLPNVYLPYALGPGSESLGGPQGVELDDAQRMPDLFSHVAAYAAGGLNLADADHPTRVKAGVVTADFFATLGVGPQLGRTFVPAEGVAHGPDVAVLGYGLWQRTFGGGNIVGKAIVLNNRAYTVIGVMPKGFGFPDGCDLWIPLSVPVTFATFDAFRGSLVTTAIARIVPGLTITAARRQFLARWEQRVASAANDPRARLLSQTVQHLRATGALLPLQQELAGDRRTALLVVLGATVLLLLVTCANVMTLLLSQAAARRHELAVRAVLGASRGRIVGQLLIESTALAVGGAVLGVALAPAALGVIGAIMPAHLGGLAPATIDARVMTFAAGLAMLTGVGFGLWPALGTTRDAAPETIKSAGRTATGRGAGRVRRVLVGMELALTVVLLVGSLLMLRSFNKLMSLDRGMQTERVGTLQIAFASATGDRAVRLRAIDAIVGRLASMPGVTVDGAINDLPLDRMSGVAVMVKPDVGQPAGGDFAGGRYLMASAGYFETMGIPVKRGRTFTASDDSLAPPVAVISETMARQFWPGVDAVGHTFMMMTTTPITIVGVVADVRESGLERDLAPQMYFPIAEQTPSSVAIVARSALEPDVLLARMRDAVRAVDPRQAVFGVRMMDEVVSESVAPRRTNTLLISVFAALALLLSAVGVYAVVSFGVSQRTREFGIRAALGASAGDLVRLVSGELVTVVAVGLATGIGAAWMVANVLRSMIFGVTVHDPSAFLAAPAALILPAVVAALLPARRAGRVNPADVMRVD